MKSKLPFIFLTLALSLGCAQKPAHDNLTMWYNSPAAIWEETLPLGNGRIGMMLDGGLATEKIVLNDITMWSGSWEDASNPLAKESLPKIQKLLLEGKNDEAEQLMYSTFVCKGAGSGRGQGKNVPFGCFQMLGNLDITYKGVASQQTTYERGLDLKSAVAYTYAPNMEREYFSSFSDDVSIIKLTSKGGEKINCVLRLSRPERAESYTEDGSLIMKGALSSGVKGVEGLRFYTLLSVKNNGGKVTYQGDSVVVENAKEAIVLISDATNFEELESISKQKSSLSTEIIPLKGENEVVKAERLLKDAMSKDYKTLKADHIKAYSKFFDRAQVVIGTDQASANIDIPTNERLERLKTASDPAFGALYLQYARYLLISSSREGLLPANLQGLWANQVQTPWNGDYHLNINVQMNYWIAEACNLSDLHKPLMELTKALVPSGEYTAQQFYGADGWVTHIITNVWQYTAPGEHPSWGATNTAAGWLCQHLYTHYLYTQDKAYLAEIYPVMKGASEFFLSSMIEEPSHGWLVTAPTTSPENAFFLPDNGKGNKKRRAISICMGSTMDNQIVKELYRNTAEAAKILGTDADFAKELDDARARIAPHIVSPNGYLQEWLEDYQEAEPQHRHVSHLYGLHPSNLITKTKTPELIDPCRQTLERRGDGGTGWSRAWKTNFWARLGDGDRALKLLKSLWTPAVIKDGINYKIGGGTYPNLFCAHPPFQIDGNFGGASGVTEMLLQSHDGFVEFLPALPKEWSEGHFEGFKVEGNAEVSCRWKGGEIVEFTLTPASTGEFKILIPSYLDHSKLSIKGENWNFDGDMLIANGPVTAKYNK